MSKKKCRRKKVSKEKNVERMDNDVFDKKNFILFKLTKGNRCTGDEN
jgi:hypothetical protein